MCYKTNINFLLTVTAKVDVFVFALPLFFLKSFSISTLHIRIIIYVNKLKITEYVTGTTVQNQQNAIHVYGKVHFYSIKFMI